MYRKCLNSSTYFPYTWPSVDILYIHVDTLTFCKLYSSSFPDILLHHSINSEIVVSPIFH